MLQSNCSLFTEVKAAFYLAKIDTTEKMSSKYFIVILSRESYFVILESQIQSNVVPVMVLRMN